MPTFWFVSNLGSLGYKVVELFATLPDESDILALPARESYKYLRIFSWPTALLND